MKKYLIWLLIAMAVGLALFVLFSQGLFTASDGETEPADDVVKIEENADTEEELVDDAADEETPDETNEPAGDERQDVSNDEGFTISAFPYQEFIQARGKGEPIVLKFYSET